MPFHLIPQITVLVCLAGVIALCFTKDEPTFEIDVLAMFLMSAALFAVLCYGGFFDHVR